MFTDNHRDAILETMDGVTYTTWSPFCGLIADAGITSFRAGTVTETTYTGYARPAASVSFGAVANTSPTGGRQKANDAVVTFPQNTGGNVTVIAWGLWTLQAAGSLKMIGFLDADPPILGVASDTTTEDIVAPAHGLSTDQRVYVLAAPGAVIPTGLAENTAYFVLAAGLTADQFRVSTTSAGAAVNITAKGAAMFMPYTAVTIATNATPEFASGAIVVQL